MKVEVYKDLQQRIPERIVEKAVVGMLPKNSYGRELFRHLKVYKGAAHPHEAQVKRCCRSTRRSRLPLLTSHAPLPPSQTPEALTFGGLTSEPDSRVLDLQDPDAMFCATD